MYYVVLEYYVEAGCELLSIVEQIPENQVIQRIVFSSENYDDCSQLVELYDQELDEQAKFKEANAG
ncbi:hypothetical protein [Nostoc sp.]|uniref:hypothetical protein n=1 Tax=Nostoc sp. TaxID=1180 RepID=UPI002FF5FD38